MSNSNYSTNAKPLLKRMLKKNYMFSFIATSVPGTSIMKNTYGEFPHEELHDNMKTVLEASRFHNFNHYIVTDGVNYGALIFKYIYNIITSLDSIFKLTKENTDHINKSLNLLKEIYNEFRYKIRINENFYEPALFCMIEQKHVTDENSYIKSKVQELNDFIKSIITDMASVGMSIDINIFSEKRAYSEKVAYVGYSLKKALPEFHQFMIDSNNKSNTYRFDIEKILNIYIIKDVVGIIMKYF